LNSRYPNNWSEIALKLKQQANWKCEKCGLQCLMPNDDVSRLSKSERMKITLNVHHKNYRPEDNRPENLICLCTACHLSYHTRGRGNVSIYQLSLTFGAASQSDFNSYQ
jgi:hypothetical protein